MNRKMLSGGALLLALGLFVAVNIVSNATLTTWRADLTENKLYTLSDGTLNILAELQEPVTLRYYYAQRALIGYPRLLHYGARVRDMLEEYAARSNGMLQLSVIDPEPFSEAEDQAVAYGLRQLPLGGAGEVAYMGLVGSNMTDDELTIAFFHPEQEESLEYELTKLVFNLANPKRRVVGVISELPLFGAPGGQPWTLVNMLRETFEVRDLGRSTPAIPAGVDTLLLIHPKALSEQTRFAIDQFVLRGGRAMIFVDPLSEADDTQPDPEAPMVMPRVESDLPELFQRWGLELMPQKIAGDPAAAIRIQIDSGRGLQEVEYVPWLRLDQSHFNSEDFVTNQLGHLNMGSAGILRPLEDATTEFTPLIRTSPQSMAYERDAIIFQRNPAVLLEIFEPGGESLVIAARINGPVESAFPDGPPASVAERVPAAAEDYLPRSRGPVNLVVVADTDFLSDRFWVQVQNFMGVRVPYPVANNADFVINTLDHLGGNSDLISLRSRGRSDRPFTRVQAIQREAEAQFRDKEQALQRKLEETEARLEQLQQQRDDAGASVMLSPAQRQEIERFREEQINTRQELRAVQHDLQRNIQRLGTQIKFINIGLVPILVGLFAVGMGLYRLGRRPGT